jgi:hypothetical protein
VNGSTAMPLGEPSSMPKSATPANISSGRGWTERKTEYSVSSSAAYCAGFGPDGHIEVWLGSTQDS